MRSVRGKTGPNAQHRNARSVTIEWLDTDKPRSEWRWEVMPEEYARANGFTPSNVLQATQQGIFLIRSSKNVPF